MIEEDHSTELVIREVTEGTRMAVKWNIHGMTPENVYVEVPNELYYIEFKDGTPAINHPVETYVNYCYDDLKNVDQEIWKHHCVIECSYNGDYYRYEKNEEEINRNNDISLYDNYKYFYTSICICRGNK